jgi:DNA recombination protein RmuC
VTPGAVVIAIGLAAVLLVLVALVVLLLRRGRDQEVRLAELAERFDAGHLAMLRDLHEGLERLGERVSGAGRQDQALLRAALEEQLARLRESLAQLQTATRGELAAVREGQMSALGEQRQALFQAFGDLRTGVLEGAVAALSEQARTQSRALQDSLGTLSQQLTATVESLTRTADARLEQIQGRVDERLQEGFRRTNDAFAGVMARLATIDEAQRKIDGLTSNVVGLQELLGDKRSRGAFGEVQLENLVRNLLPPAAYAFQHTLSNGHRADCVLRLPEPTGQVAVDAKFPLENYRRMLDLTLGEAEQREARRLFRADVRRHVDDIAARYILPGVTSDSAVMFVPAEAVFAEIHAHHAEVVEHAMKQRVWIVSPTTLMAVLNTARAVIRDVETRRQVHVIKDELARLGKDFARFDERMRRLATHIRQAHEDADQVQTSTDKIVRRFRQIEQVDLRSGPEPATGLPAAAEPRPEEAG